MPLAPLSAGQHLHGDSASPGGGRFVIEKPLSAGGFAITYLARDQQLDDRCVIKELAIDQLMLRSGNEMVPLPGREADVAVWVQKVQKEAQTLHRLRSAGVVPIRATWRELGTAYFAMDFVDGIELPAEPTAGAAWATWEPVARKFLAALGAIHAAGLVHGDIKPQNVLVNREGNPVIIDFGTARSTEEAKKTKLTTLAMTPGYCPPELAVRDRAKEMGPWSDLYSWALTVMGLVIRHGGIDGAPLDTSARMALAKHGHSDAGIGDESASALRAAGVPENWVRALMACVALQPEARPQSAEEVAARIDAAPVKAKPARYAAIEAQSASPPASATENSSDAIASFRAGPLLAAPADNSTNRVALLVMGVLVAGAVFVLIVIIIGYKPATAPEATMGSGGYGSGPAPSTSVVPSPNPLAAGSGEPIEDLQLAGLGSGAAVAPIALETELQNEELARAFDSLSDNDALQAIFQNNDLGLANGKNHGSRGSKRPRATVSGRARIAAGLLTNEQVEKVIRRNKSSIKYCYERELVSNPRLSGRIGAQWTVGLDGNVITASVSENTIGSRAIEPCLLGVINGMKFDPPNGGIVVISYPFTFQTVVD